MNWYKWYPGDFMRDTGSLTMIQRGAYRDLLDHCYSTEQPLPLKRSELFLIAKAQSAAERAAVISVLRFFSEIDGGYRHKRVDEQIAKANTQSAINKQTALRAWNARKNDANRIRIAHGSHTNGNANPDATRLPDLKATAKAARRRTN